MSMPEKLDRIEKSEVEWKSQLSPEAYRVARKHGTERPFTSPLNHEHRPGTFTCVCCGSDLFSSAAKFDSGTGWPSYTAPITPDAVT
ncbi:MAG: peptide-methionine (R)-S-oxide reductase, partial [Pseudomonadota bacterium]